MRFAEPWLLLLLVLAPALIAYAVYVERKKRRDMELAFHPDLLLSLTRAVHRGRRRWKWALLVSSLVFLVIALARPQWGRKTVNLERRGIDIVFVIDVSKSMLAEDIKPNRLEKAKIQIASFLDRLAGDRVGLVVFAGSAFVSCPLTLDYNAMKLFIDVLDTDMVARQGTLIGNALHTARSAFSGEDRKHRAVILLTDGEDFDTTSLDEAKACAKEGIRVFAIGLGTRSGEPIPIRDENGEISGYLKDAEGKVVMSRLDERSLENIAKATGGRYDFSEHGDLDLGGIYQSLQSIEKRMLDSQKVEQSEDHFQIFLMAALLCLLLEFFLVDRRKETPGVNA